MSPSVIHLRCLLYRGPGIESPGGNVIHLRFHCCSLTSLLYCLPERNRHSTSALRDGNDAGILTSRSFNLSRVTYSNNLINTPRVSSRSYTHNLTTQLIQSNITNHDLLRHITGPRPPFNTKPSRREAIALESRRLGRRAGRDAHRRQRAASRKQYARRDKAAEEVFHRTPPPDVGILGPPPKAPQVARAPAGAECEGGNKADYGLFVWATEVGAAAPEPKPEPAAAAAEEQPQCASVQVRRSRFAAGP